MVHGETSTGRIHPLKEIGEACRAQDALFIVDAVATIGGCAVKRMNGRLTQSSGNAKCLSVPSGMAPITYNDRTAAVIAARKR